MLGFIAAAIVAQTVTSAYSANKQAKAMGQANRLNQQAFEAEQKARRLEEKRRDIAAARERRQLVREARIARGETLSTAGAAGVSQTSGLAGGLAATTAQAAQGISFLNVNQSISQNQSMFMQQAANLQTQAQKVQTQAQISAARLGALSDIFGAAASIGKLDMQNVAAGNKSIFGG